MARRLQVRRGRRPEEMYRERNTFSGSLRRFRQKVVFEAIFAINLGVGVFGFEHCLANLAAIRASNFVIFGFHLLAVHLAAVFATGWFIGKALVGKKLLLASCPNKIVAALFALEGFVFELHVGLVYQNRQF